jgi:holo-[acyl-carrier protein] synthase
VRIVRHGIDIVDVPRVQRLVQREGGRFLQRCFTPGERAHGERSLRHVEHLAARFAAKEAAFKALGTGWSDGIAWTDVEVVSGPAGAPSLRVTGRAADVAARLGITAWLVSLSHTRDLAVASVIALGPGSDSTAP